MRSSLSIVILALVLLPSLGCSRTGAGRTSNVATTQMHANALCETTAHRSVTQLLPVTNRTQPTQNLNTSNIYADVAEITQAVQDLAQRYTTGQGLMPETKERLDLLRAATTTNAFISVDEAVDIIERCPKSMFTAGAEVALLRHLFAVNATNVAAQARVLYSLSAIYNNFKHHREAAQYLEQVITLYSSLNSVNDNRIEHLHGMCGNVFLSAGYYDEAVSHYSRQAEMCKDSERRVKIYCNVMECISYKGDRRELTQYYAVHPEIAANGIKPDAYIKMLDEGRRYKSSMIITYGSVYEFPELLRKNMDMPNGGQASQFMHAWLTEQVKAENRR